MRTLRGAGQWAIATPRTGRRVPARFLKRKIQECEALKAEIASLQEEPGPLWTRHSPARRYSDHELNVPKGADLGFAGRSFILGRAGNALGAKTKALESGIGQRRQDHNLALLLKR
jgi:hypothetical protein